MKRSSASPLANRTVRYLLFADVVGFSKLPEHAIPHYVQHFLGGVASVLQQKELEPLTRNTWGDALYLVYESASAAARAALALQHWCKSIPWDQRLGLKRGAQLRLRLGLHVGPVFMMEDPVIGQPCFMGRNTSLAARLEPIAEEGQILASEEFAALAAHDSERHFRLQYVGILPLPKQSGSHAVYLLLPAIAQTPKTAPGASALARKPTRAAAARPA